MERDCLDDLGGLEGHPLKLHPGTPRDYLLHHGVCPVGDTAGGELLVAAVPGVSPEAVNDLEFLYNRPLCLRLMDRDNVERLVERAVTRVENQVEAVGEGLNGGAPTDIRRLATQPPVIRYVNLILRDAHEQGASDIHLEATSSGCAARVRIDGVLSPALSPPFGMERAVVSRIKLLADLDIAERRRPQDGRVRVRLDSRDLDIRVSTVPTMFGESVVLRLLDHGGRPVDLSDLGLPDALLRHTREVVSRPHGMVMATGPTGSGKTTTLYAAIRERSASREKIVTVEDPVEYQLPGITQVPVHRQAGVTFASALRSILRQDPDVLMIGEMRDGETAEIGVQAAMTGHLVLTTLHTNDAAGAVPRLLDLGIPSYLVSATLEAVLAQRLVRRICPECSEIFAPSGDLRALLPAEVKDAPLRRGRGCAACRGTGYRGRIGVFELLRADEPVKRMISSGCNAEDFRGEALVNGLTLMDDAWAKVLAGMTTVEEVLRVSDA